MMTRTQGALIGWAFSMLLVIGVTSCGFFIASEWAEARLDGRIQYIEEVTR